MVASISARGGVEAALGYYSHLGRDDYYTRANEPPGGWAGEAAARLSLSGPVTRSDFDAALRGIDPRTGEQLARLSSRATQHAAGWDMTFSAPKSVSVLWALSEPQQRHVIERAQTAAVATAMRYLEQNAAWARRGKGGANREPTAGLLMATFDHHTSRALDPQLHTHVFIVNLAPRRDGTWGAIVSRELYKAQKQAGAIYRTDLAKGLERGGCAVERLPNCGFRAVAIPRHVQRAFSKRRDAIETAAAVHGYRSAAGMERAALRTRATKRALPREQLFEAWRREACAMGFELGRQGTQRGRGQSVAAPHADLRVAGRQLASAAQRLESDPRMPGLAVSLRQSEQDRGERER